MSEGGHSPVSHGSSTVGAPLRHPSHNLAIRRPESAGSVSGELPTDQSVADGHIATNEPGSSHGQSDNWHDLTATWAPHFLRRPFICLVATSALLLLLVVGFIYWYSETNDGLGLDNGSSVILFGWRFTPSLLAVAYVQLTAMLLDDVKRTEPIARLARPGGAGASSTILQTSGAWWNALADGVSLRKNGRRPSWLLVCASFLNVLGFLTISPLSSSLLASKDVEVTKRVEFARMIPSKSPIDLATNRDTYLRTIGHILQDVPTPAWITDTYTIVPTWPSHLGDAPLGPFLTTSRETWETEALVLTTELECQSMKLAHTGYQNDSFIMGEKPHWGLKASIILESQDGCTFGLAVDPSMDIAQSGGGSWSDLSRFLSPSWSKSGAISWNDSSSAQLRLNHSDECGDRELLFITTPWFGTSPDNDLTSGVIDDQTSIAFSKDFKASGQICSSNYIFNFNEKDYQKHQVAVPDSLLSIDALQKLMLAANWTNYMSRPNSQFRPYFGGLSAILASRYDFDVTAVLDDEDVGIKAAKIKQRFLGEVLQSSLSRRGASGTDVARGGVTVIERRVTVTSGIAVSVVAILCISVCLSLLILVLSNPQLRPLNLKEDPATATGIASLVAFETTTRLGLRNLDRSTKREMRESFREKTYYTTPNILHETDHLEGNTYEPTDPQSSSDWRSSLLRLRALSALVTVLIFLLAAVIVLYHFSERSLLYQSAFIYQANLFNISTIAPFSVLSTLIAVGVGFWWAAVDSHFRRLQPYLAMANAPTRLSNGAGLSYQSSYWAWATAKAFSNKHWLLCPVTLGTSLSPVFTIAMSALFRPDQGVIPQSSTIGRSLYLRQVPLLYQDIPEDTSPGSSREFLNPITASLYTHLSTNWIYTATIQLALNGSEPGWSSDGWSFVPIDLSLAEGNGAVQNVGSSSFTPGKNVSLSTPAIRARLECTPYHDLANTSQWLTAADLTNDSVWNASTIPEDVITGYQIGVGGPHSNGFFVDTNVLGTATYLACCSNGTINSRQGRSAVGYWSKTDPLDAGYKTAWQNKITVEWFYGHLLSGLRYVNQTDDVTLFTEIPKVQALHCQPVIETATAHVTVDQKSGRVRSYMILDDSKSASEAWKDLYIARDHKLLPPPSYGLTQDISVSYGVLFQDAMLYASNILLLSGERTNSELMEDMAFNFRDLNNGLNMDFMTYSMFILANKNPEALLNASILQRHAQKAFSTFFQHFVSSNFSIETGGWAYQQINGSRQFDPVPGQSLPPGNGSIPQTPEDVSRTAVIDVHTRVEMLKVNAVAAWLSVAILAWFILTVIVVAVMEGRHLKRLIRDVECPADVLILISRSERLLQLVRNKDVEGQGSEDDVQVMTKLGWFQNSEDKERWGIEMVDDAAERP